MTNCITCKWYTHKETADGMVRKCVLDGKSIYPNDTCIHYQISDNSSFFVDPAHENADGSQESTENTGT